MGLSCPRPPSQDPGGDGGGRSGRRTCRRAVGLGRWRTRDPGPRRGRQGGRPEAGGIHRRPRRRRGPDQRLESSAEASGDPGLHHAGRHKLATADAHAAKKEWPQAMQALEDVKAIAATAKKAADDRQAFTVKLADVTMGMKRSRLSSATFNLLSNAIANANAQAMANNYVAANATLDAAAVELRARLKSRIDTVKGGSPTRRRTRRGYLPEARARPGQGARRRRRDGARRPALERGRDGGNGGAVDTGVDRADGTPARLLRNGTGRDRGEDRHGQGQRVGSPTAARARRPARRRRQVGRPRRDAVRGRRGPAARHRHALRPTVAAAADTEAYKTSRSRPPTPSWRRSTSMRPRRKRRGGARSGAQAASRPPRRRPAPDRGRSGPRLGGGVERGGCGRGPNAAAKTLADGAANADGRRPRGEPADVAAMKTALQSCRPTTRPPPRPRSLPRRPRR